ncbi:MAG: hypothetical protein ACE5EH_03590 [Gammaproteobacteria bacterium]
MLDPVKQKLAQYNSLNIRERVLILAVLLGAIFVIWNLTFYGGFEDKLALRQSNITKIQKETADIFKQVQLVTESRENDPRLKKQAYINQLRVELAKANEQLKFMTKSLVKPSDMAKLLEELLLQNSSLQLLKVETLGAVPLVSKSNNNDEEADKDIVYRHTIVLDFKGEYFSTLDFLHAVEQLPWKIFWGGIDYDVIDYPMASISLKVNTLSMNSGWIGI